MNGGNQQPSIDASEHASVADGEGVDAKKVVNYGWSGTGTKWKRQPAPLLDEPYDYVAFSNADGNGNYQTISFNTGGSGGTTVRTLSLTFDGNSNVTTITRA